MADLLGVLDLEPLQLREALVVCFDGGHVGVNLGLDGGLLLIARFLESAEEGAVCLGELVLFGAQVAGLGDGGAVEAVKFDDLVHHRQLLVLEFLADVLFDDLRVFPDKFDVEHGVIYLP